MKVKEFLSEISPAAFSLSLSHLPSQVLHTFRGGRSPLLTRLGGLRASCWGFRFSLWNGGVGWGGGGGLGWMISEGALLPSSRLLWFYTFGPFSIWAFIFWGGG